MQINSEPNHMGNPPEVVGLLVRNHPDSENAPAVIVCITTPLDRTPIKR